jgi:tRNA pseudouridine38-40 synthase
MPRYRVTLAYDGTQYLGWQIQPSGPTIQGELEQCLTQMAGHRVRVVGAGRTDAGVHAHGQVAHFKLDNPIPPDGLLRGLNSLLPEDIRVRESSVAPDDFHARYSARAKTYRYFIDLSPVALPMRSRFAHHYPHPIDRGAMDAAAKCFLGRHDFVAFAASSTEVETTVRECFESRFFEQEPELVYEINATGFLHHMVRNIVGTLLEVGRGKITPDSIDALFDSKDRRLSGPTAPARGLHLMEVEYS